MANKISIEQRQLSARYHSELARYSTWLFSSILVALTFLLLAGLKNPKLPLQIFLYTALIAFALSILVYLIIQSLNVRLIGAADKEKEDKLSLMLKQAEIAHQILFVIALIAISGFAVEVIMLFFAVPAASSQPGSTGQ